MSGRVTRSDEPGWVQDGISRMVDTGPPRCAWTEGDRQCWMVGSCPRGAMKRCSWHDMVLDLPRLAGDLVAFEEWVTGLLDAGYCTPWTHARAGDLWAAVRGERPAPATIPCRQGRCRDQYEIPEGPAMGRIQAARAAKALVLELSKQGAS